VCHNGPVNSDLIIIITKIEEFPPYELSVIVCDNAFRHAESMYEFSEELNDIADVIVVIGFSSFHFVNLSIDCNDEVGV